MIELIREESKHLKSRPVAVNFPPSHVKIIKQVTKQRGESMANFIRTATYEKLSELERLKKSRDKFRKRFWRCTKKGCNTIVFFRGTTCIQHGGTSSKRAQKEWGVPRIIP
jgi:hypothetical protein